VDAPPLERLVDDAEDAGDAPDRRGEQEHDAERDEEPPEHVQVVLEGRQHWVGLCGRGMLRPYLVP